MYRPHNLIAALLSAALLCTTGIALADKGGNHDKHGGSSAQSAPGSSNNSNSKAASQSGPGGIGGPRSAPGPFERGGMRGSEFEGNVDAAASRRGSTSANAAISVKLSNGATRTFDISDAALNALKTHQGRGDLIFFTTNGKEITAISSRGEKSNMRVIARSGDTFTLESNDGQERVITLDSKTASRLQVKVGCHLQVTTNSATSGRIVALDLEKKHDFDKFNRRSDVDVAKADIDRAKTDIDAKAKKAKKADVDVVKADIDAVKSDVDTAKAKKSKKLDKDVAKLDNDERKLDMDVANGGCGRSSSRSGNPAFANQMAKDAANDASGHNPPGLPHECVNPAGHTRGFCKSSSSESICGGGSGNGGGENEVAANPSKPCAPSNGSKSHANPAFANQMAKDAANDASGYNPPGLPHECVNPAGHTRGFCKTRETEGSAMCGGSSGGNGVAPSELHGGIARGSVPVPGTAGAPVNGINANGATSRGVTSGSGTRGPGSPVGFIPVGGGSFAPSGSGTRGPGTAGAPTHVLGASTGPSGRRVAALPARVLPVAIQPVGKRRCVWYKTGVLGASTGPYRIIGTSANGSKPVLHKKCR